MCGSGLGAINQDKKSDPIRNRKINKIIIKIKKATLATKLFDVRKSLVPETYELLENLLNWLLN